MPAAERAGGAVKLGVGPLPAPAVEGERRSTTLIMRPGPHAECPRHLLLRDELGNCPACKGGR